MKHFKSVLAMLLALVMVLSCVGTAFAAEDKELSVKTEITEIAKNTKEPKEEKLLGFKSESFQMNNTYRYADDEIVRAIVILEGQSEAEVGETGSEKAATQRVKLVNQHNGIFKKMAGIDYELKYEFTRLLNGFSCDVAYGDLEAIAAIEGVASVHIANHFEAPVLETAPDTKQNLVNQIVGNTSMHGYNWDGYGMVVAVLDTGLALDHEAFQDFAGWAEFYGSLTKEEVEAAELLSEGVYVSPKIPYAYDYADRDADVTDADGHGTHVSGSAVGMAGEIIYDEDRNIGLNITFSGAAPAAQLLSMKIFSDAGGGTSSDIYFYALEDAYSLGADVINMSIGAQNGFTYDESLETEVFGNIYQRLCDAGVILSIAAGNEYSMANFSSVYEGYIGAIGPEYTDYGTVATPSTYEGSVSVASLENLAYPDWAVEIDGTVAAFTDSCEDGEHGWIQNFGGKELPYQLILTANGQLSLGTAEDFAAYGEGALDGKIAIVSRGEIDFETKVENAYNAGAIACIVVNNDVGGILMSIETFEIPAIALQQSALNALSETGVIYTPETMSYVLNPNALLMSEFSNWGTSPMLTLDPSITAIGGLVYSSVPGAEDAYEVYSGTSMAAPNMSGMYANLLSAIYEINEDMGIEMTKAEVAELAKDLIHSTAELITDADGYHYSPRKQGAGLASSWNAIANYVESAYITNPLQELGDDPEKTGVYKMSIELKNSSEFDLFYSDFETYVMYDYLIQAPNGAIVNTLTSDYAYLMDDATTAEYGAGASVTYAVDGTEITEINLAAGQSVTIDVTVTLNDAQKAYFDAGYPNGAFVEGYVVFNEIYAGEIYTSNHATFLAYYGDWTQGAVMEEADFMDVVELNYLIGTTVANPSTGETYADMGYTWQDFAMFNYYTMPNMGFLTDIDITTAYTYPGDNMLGYVPYNPDRIAFSTPLSDGTYNYAEAIYFENYLLRNVEHLIFTVTDKETGEIYCQDDTTYVRKAVYNQTAGAWAPTAGYYWDGTDMEGNYVPSGTEVTITYDAVLPYNEAPHNDIWTIDATVDYTAPVLEEITYDEETMTLTVTASDENYLQGIYIADMWYEILDYAVVTEDVKGGSFTATFDVSELVSSNPQIYVTALDYATNEMEELVAILPNIGEPATITFNTPYGTESYEVLIGDEILFPEGPAIGNGDFLFWATEPVEYATGYEIYMVGGTWYFAGDVIMVPGDITVYALYQAGEILEYETPNYFYTQDTNYNGVYALCGWDYADSYVVTDPLALNSALETTRVADYEGATVGDYYVEFYSGDPSIAFTMASDELGRYTIQAADGKYLAVVDSQLVTVEEVTDEAKWTISLSYNGTLIYNAVEESMVILYNEDTGAIELFDDSQPIGWILALVGLEIYPSEYYQLLTYKQKTTYIDEESLFYSTVGEFDCLHPNTEIRDAKEATCTEDGYTGDTYCLNCGELLAEGEVIPATGHNYVDGICTVCGAEDPDYTNPCYFNDFSDCEAEWYHEAVDFVVANGLMNGVGGNKFEPNTTLTRAMVVTVLYRLEGCPEVSEPSTFTDVPADAWYADAVAWAQDEGIVLGVILTEFAPDQAVTREQLATILWRYEGCPEEEADLSSFGDADTISPYAQSAMNMVVARGIVKGDGKNLNPLDQATRAEFACMMMRYLEGEYTCKE